MANQVLSLIPHFADYVTSRLEYMFVRLFSSRQLTIVVDERTGLYRNQMFNDSETYLRSKLTTDSASSMHRIKAGKTPRDKKFLLDFENNEKINDIFHGIQLKWKLVYNKEEKPMVQEKKWFELIFDKKHKGIVLDSYLPHVMEESESLREKNKVLKLYTPSRLHGDQRGSGPWRSINLEHPATFHKLAMGAKLKTAVSQDLYRFIKRRKFYRRVGKAWKRGYQLYGPPGTGKSSLIAAMANYLNYDIYDLDLASILTNSELRELLISTTNRSILVIEDIDCSIDMETRRSKGGSLLEDQSLTLSGLLNCIDGLWSSCGDERIIVVTTNYKDQLDPALLRPGRMDMHIHMSYCTPCDFRFLAFRYLQIHDHPLFKLIEQLIAEVQVTPAEVAEELMKSDDVGVNLNGLIDFIHMKNVKNDGVKGQEKVNEGEERVDGNECEGLNGANIEIQTYKKRRVRKLLSSGDVGEPSVPTIGKSSHPNGKSSAPPNVKASKRKALGSKRKKGC